MAVSRDSVRRLLTASRRLLVDERGTSLPMVALILLPLLGFIGLATDAGRGYLIKARLGDALDSAALAGAQAVFDQAQFESDVRMYFDANFPPGFMGANVDLVIPENVGPDDETITLSATATIDSTFTRIIGYDSLTVSSSTEVTRMTASMDIVLAIDMSKSMTWDDGNGSPRIDGARAAAKELVDLLFGEDATKELLNIAVVPWNGKVNVMEAGVAYDSGATTSSGGLFFPNNTPVPLKSAPDSDWTGCVYARYTDNGDPDDDADAILGPTDVGGMDWNGWNPIQPNGDPTPIGSCTDNKCRICLQNGITRLTNVRADIDDAIDDLTDPTGTTNIAQGLAWAWRVLLPGEPFDDADANPAGRHQRAIVLLTDGEHQARLHDGYSDWFGTGTSAGPGGMDDRLKAVAAAVKADGVQIYAIQYFFDTGDLADLMKEVASGTAAPYYHFAPDGDALKDVFTEVANHLSELRLSK